MALSIEASEGKAVGSDEVLLYFAIYMMKL
jgi:hypothetical protein